MSPILRKISAIGSSDDYHAGVAFNLVLHLFRSLCNRICVQLMLELKVIDDAKPYFIFILVMCSFSYKVVMHCHCFCPNCCPEKMSKIDIDMCTVSLSFTPPQRKVMSPGRKDSPLWLNRIITGMSSSFLKASSVFLFSILSCSSSATAWPIYIEWGTERMVQKK